MSWWPRPGPGDLRPPPPTDSGLSLTLISDMGNYHPRATRAGSSVIRSAGGRRGSCGITRGTSSECHHSPLSWAAVKTLILLEMQIHGMVMVTRGSFALFWIVRIKITTGLLCCFHLSNWLLSARQQQNDLGEQSWESW